LPIRALIVDDDLSTCEMIQAILLSADMEATFLTRSADASEILQKQRFDAIFLDVKMPPPDGMELARQVRLGGYNRSTPVIMITGVEDPAVLHRAFKAGANFVLFKPIHKQRLLNLIRVAHGAIDREKRRFQRVPVRRNVRLQCGNESVEGETIDVCLSGALVQASRALPVGSAVQIRLDAWPGREPIVADGRVARIVGDNRIGIYLDRISTAESLRLQEFLLPLILATPDPAALPVQS
jgi:CheY-like chemotaxis protein